MQFVPSERHFGRSLAPGAALIAAFRGMTRLAAAFRRRRHAASLLKLSDHMLQDIGVTRFDVTSALSSPLLCDPTTDLAAFAAERRAAARAQARQRLVRSGRKI